MSDFLLWAGMWLAMIAVAGYMIYLVVATIFRVIANLWGVLKIVTRHAIHDVSTEITVFIVKMCRLLRFYIGREIKTACAPVAEKIRKAQENAADRIAREQDDMGKKRAWEMTTNYENPARLARAILGLPDGQLTKGDVEGRRRQLQKRVHEDLGGTHWLSTQVNWAGDVLMMEAVD